VSLLAAKKASHSYRGKGAHSIECNLGKFDSITYECRLGNKSEEMQSSGNRTTDSETDRQAPNQLGYFTPICETYHVTKSIYATMITTRREQLRPYTLKCTGSRPISEVKPGLASVVLRWGTTRELGVL
jgi:hypothetical protein